MTLKQLFIYSSLFTISPSLLWGASDDEADSLFSLCPVADSSRLQYSAPPIFQPDKRENTEVSAESVQNMSRTISTFNGNVLIEKHLLRLRADTVTHDKTRQQLELVENIHADTESMSLNADSGWFNLQNNTGEFINSQYFIPGAHIFGSTPQFTVTEDEKTLLIDTQFSTCPPEKPDWHMQTSWLELDQKTSTGTAKHVVLRLKDIPIFYFPWIQFPLGDERRSGFLMPNFGTSSNNGFEINAPWYWNIAPNQDAIITPRNMHRRGLMLLTEYRYLTQNSIGDFDIEYLHDDKKLDDERYLLHFNNNTRINDQFSLNLLANDASDTDYLEDFGSNINVANTTHLERTAKLNFNQGVWKAGLMAQTYQTIDDTITETSRPYRRLPQLTLSASKDVYDIADSQVIASLESEWVDFEHEADNKVKGNRLHLYPKLSLPIESNAWFVTPSAGFMHTQYDTLDGDSNPQNIDHRNLSVFSLDSGLFFERPIQNSTLIQTLEPRLFYLNIPYEDQSDFPVFDSSEQSFSFASLFRTNRFNGIDRVGDANQLTVALSSRLLNQDSGHELMNISIGRILYFEDQRVSLDNTVNTSDSSDIVTELSGNLNNWRARATFQWNTDTDQSDKRSVQLSYAPSELAVFNVGYRFHRDTDNEDNNLEQTDLSFAWPINNHYSLLSRWNYSITEERDIETLVGLEYESCCWAIRLLSQRYLTDDTNEPYDSSIMFQFVLKGFGSITDKQATSTLKHAILGYKPDY